MALEKERKIKLLLFIPNLGCGGAEKYASLVSDHIDGSKFELTLAVLDNSAPFYPINSPAVKVIDLGVKRVRKSLFALRRTVLQYQPDIIFSLSNHLNLYLAIYRWLFPKNCKLIARESSIVSINNKRSSFPRFYSWLMKKFYHRLDLIICQSAYMHQDLVKNFNIPLRKTLIMHNPVEEIKTRSAGAENVKGTTAGHTFISVGRLSGEKGIDRVLRAISLLTIPFSYHIVGDGPDSAALAALTGELQLTGKVHFHGQQKVPFAGLEDASLLLLGSHYEGFPNAVLEAGALGIPVIAFDVPGGIPEIIQPGKNGLLVKDNDVPAFALAIEQALAMKFDKKAIIASTIKRFSVNAAIKELEELFFQLSPKA